MRTLSSTLTAGQKTATLPRLYKVVLTSGVTTHTYTSTRIIDVDYSREPYSHKATILLNNQDNVLTTLDLEGYQAVISLGIKTSAGDEYSANAPLEVRGQDLVSIQGRLYCELQCWGIPDKLAEDRASATYAPASDNTDTVKTLLSAILGASLACFNHCAAYQIVYDSEDSLIDSYIPADHFRIYKNGSRLAAARRLIDYTGCVMRFGNDGKIHIFVPTTSGTTYDYEYALGIGNHTFFSKKYRKRMVIPNHIVVSSREDDDPQYTGEATDASYSLRDIRQFEEAKLTSNAQATSIAGALILKYQLQAEGGSGEVPINVGAEEWDYVKITDSRENDFRVGNIGYVHIKINPEKKLWRMTFGFGRWASTRGLLNELETNPSGFGNEGQYFARLGVKDLYVENIQADSIDLTTIDQDDIQDGTTYARVKKTSLTAEGLVVLDDTVAGTYGLVLATQISAGKIELTSTSFKLNESGIIAGSALGTRTVLDADGLAGYSVVGEVETLQFKADSSTGKLTAAAGKIILDADGITLYRISTDGTANDLRLNYDGTLVGYLYPTSDATTLLAKNLLVGTESNGGIYIHAGGIDSAATTNQLNLEAEDDIVLGAGGDVYTYVGATNYTYIDRLKVSVSDVTSSRALNPANPYQNTNAYPILVVASIYTTGAEIATAYIGATSSPSTGVAKTSTYSTAQTIQTISFLVPAGYYYEINDTGSIAVLQLWIEYAIGA